MTLLPINSAAVCALVLAGRAHRLVAHKHQWIEPTTRLTFTTFSFHCAYLSFYIDACLWAALWTSAYLRCERSISAKCQRGTRLTTSTNLTPHASGRRHDGQLRAPCAQHQRRLPTWGHISGRYPSHWTVPRACANWRRSIGLGRSRENPAELFSSTLFHTDCCSIARRQSYGNSISRGTVETSCERQSAMV